MEKRTICFPGPGDNFAVAGGLAALLGLWQKQE